MVQLCRIPSEFDVARMRDSFLRQFLEQGGDVTAAASSGSVMAKDIPVMQPGAAGKTPDVPVLSLTQPKSVSSALARHLAVAEIVRCRNCDLNSRLLLVVIILLNNPH